MIYNGLPVFVVKSYRIHRPIVAVCPIPIRYPRAVKSLVGRDVIADFDKVAVKRLTMNCVLQQVESANDLFQLNGVLF